MSLVEPTPWEMLQEFFIEFDGKITDYTEVELKDRQFTLKLYKNADGSITVYDHILESEIGRGKYSDKSRILIKGTIKYDHGALVLNLKSAPNMILGKGRYRENSYYSINLTHYKEDGHQIKLLVSLPGLGSLSYTIDNVKYDGENGMIIQNIQQTTRKNIIQIDVDKPWDLIIGYLRNSIKRNDINKDEINRIIFYLRNDSNKYLENNSIEYLEMKRDDNDNIIINVSKKLTEAFNETDFKGNKVIKENLLIGEDGERKEIRICEENEDTISIIYIDEYPRGNRGKTMRLGFAIKIEDWDNITRLNSYKVIGIEVN